MICTPLWEQKELTMWKIQLPRDGQTVTFLMEKATIPTAEDALDFLLALIVAHNWNALEIAMRP